MIHGVCLFLYSLSALELCVCSAVFEQAKATYNYGKLLTRWDKREAKGEELMAASQQLAIALSNAPSVSPFVIY